MRIDSLDGRHRLAEEDAPPVAHRDGSAASQAELVRLLTEAGFPVTQATVSRDLAAIGAVKVAGWRWARGLPARRRYQVAPGAGRQGARHIRPLDHLEREPRRHQDPSRCRLHRGRLDRCRPRAGVIGTVAGDDTVLVVAADDVGGDDLAAEMERIGARVVKRVVLAYSGGLDTSVILRWLIETHGAEVITYTADVGQGDEVGEAVDKALATGAVDAIVEDLRHQFVDEAVFPALRANAVYEWYYLLGTSLARPIITQGLVRAARAADADAIAHGATGKGNDQVRFELSAYALEPDIEVIAPWREWDLRGRADLVAYAKEHGIAVPVTPERPYSMDANLLHVSYEGGVLEDPWESPPAGNVPDDRRSGAGTRPARGGHGRVSSTAPR